MIIVLDGLEGTGKSTAAGILSSKLGLPVYRAFRPEAGMHWTGDTHLEAMLRRLRVPVNTYVEDLFMVDMLSTVGGSAILDRSMPSAVAYGTLHKDWTEAQAIEGFSYWMDRLEQCQDVVYLYVTCDRYIAQIRSKGRRRDIDDEAHLDAKFTYCWREMSPRFNAHTLDTSNHGVEGMMADIAKRIGKEIS